VAEENKQGSGIRERILKFITEHPGTHLRQIKRELNLAMGVIQYHLHVLERERKVLSRRTGIYRRFYASLIFGDSQISILGVLSQEVERELVLYLIQNPGATQKDVAEFANVSPATIHWHIKKLKESGLVEAKHEGTFVRYSVNGDNEEIISLIKRYHQNIWEKWASRLADLVTDASGVETNKEDAREKN
jgi:predicted transcriptional regulator